MSNPEIANSPEVADFNRAACIDFTAAYFTFVPDQISGLFEHYLPTAVINDGNDLRRIVDSVAKKVSEVEDVGILAAGNGEEFSNVNRRFATLAAQHGLLEPIGNQGNSDIDALTDAIMPVIHEGQESPCMLMLTDTVETRRESQFASRYGRINLDRLYVADSFEMTAALREYGLTVLRHIVANSVTYNLATHQLPLRQVMPELSDESMTEDTSVPDSTVHRDLNGLLRKIENTSGWDRDWIQNQMMLGTEVGLLADGTPAVVEVRYYLEHTAACPSQPMPIREAAQDILALLTEL